MKHVYEIALIKKSDPTWEHAPLEDVCKAVIRSAHTCGVDVVRTLDAAEYGKFLEERRMVVEQQEKEIQEAKAAKMLRVAAAAAEAAAPAASK